MFYFKMKCTTCVDKWMKRKIGNIKENFQRIMSLSALILYFWWTSSYYYHYYYSLSPLCRVSTLTYLKETIFLGYTVLQLFCSCIFCTFTLRLSEVCVQCPLWLFSVAPYYYYYYYYMCKNSCKVLDEESKGRDHFEDLDIDGRLSLSKSGDAAFLD